MTLKSHIYKIIRWCGSILLGMGVGYCIGVGVGVFFLDLCGGIPLGRVWCILLGWVWGYSIGGVWGYSIVMGVGVF